MKNQKFEKLIDDKIYKLQSCSDSACSEICTIVLETEKLTYYTECWCEGSLSKQYVQQLNEVSQCEIVCQSKLCSEIKMFPRR